jgi:glucuronoarabinoxylan endo-1,4-beta-xylanase
MKAAREMKRWTMATVLALLTGAILLAGSSLARAADITVDCSQKFQTIEGFGTCINGWTKQLTDLYIQPEFQKMYLDDLGCEATRLDLYWTVLKDEVADAKDISYKNFKWDLPRPMAYIQWAKDLTKLDPNVKVIGSVWTPPQWMKENSEIRNADDSCGGRLRPDRYEHFARYLAEWVIGMKEVHGVKLYAVCPQNELNFKEPYNSCVYNPQEYHDMMVWVGKVFKEKGLDTLIYGPEDMTDQVGRSMKYIDAVMEAPDTKDVLTVIASHGYYGGTLSAGTQQENASLWNAVKPFGHELWMTETGGGDGVLWDPAPAPAPAEGAAPAAGGRRPRGATGALNGLGAMMHNALAYGNVSLWTLWQVSDPSGDAGSCLLLLDKPTKKYQVAKHYSHYVRSGAKRVAATPDGEGVTPDGKGGLFVTAFDHEKNKTVTLVLQNRGTAESKVSVTVKSSAPVASFDAIVTDKDRDCAALPAVAVKDGKAEFTMPARSMMTLQGKY